MPLLYTTIDSPLGRLLAVGDGHALMRLHMEPFSLAPEWIADATGLPTVRTQLQEYFSGQRRRFELPLAPTGTPFERSVWDALLEIPYGETASYGQIAQRIGAPGSARAVGLANSHNPIAVVIPCHRVIGANGSLTGYGGGLARKRLLLDLEAGILPLQEASLARSL